MAMDTCLAVVEGGEEGEDVAAAVVVVALRIRFTIEYPFL
jgi:hypothetical protein